MGDLSFRRSFTVDAAPERLWPLLSYTDRLNRALGLPPVRYEPQPDGAPLRARSSFLRMPVEWDEHPFEWVYARSYAVERVFPHGPIRRVYGGVLMKSAGDGKTEVEVFADVAPRNAAGWIAAKMVVGPKATEGVAEACRTFTRYLAGLTEDAFARDEEPPRVEEAVLADRLAKVTRAGVDAGIVGRLGSLVRTGRDEEVVRVRPFELAERWKLPRMDLLRAFLYAASAGVFDLEWEVLCPNCRIAKVEEKTLERLVPAAHCEFCNIRFDLQFDLNVELRFSVNPNVRVAQHAIYCIGGPGNTPHVLAQMRLRPRASVEAVVPLGEGIYRLRVPGRGEPIALEVSPAASGAEVALTIGDVLPADTRLAARPGDVRLRLASESDREALVLVEDRRWHSLGASAALVTSLQEFRELFSSEVLAPGLALSIRSLAVVFTDLKGSTALYERMGDSPAFGLVRKHFDLLVGAIREHQGTLVKTIGDAVMAAFLSNTDAVRAMLEMQRRVAQFNRENPASAIVVKMGAHFGPCVAVNANGTLDYFGTTVNLAARIQGESEGGDAVLSFALANEPGVREMLEREGLVPEVGEREVKGISRPVRLARLWPAGRILR